MKVLLVGNYRPDGSRSMLAFAEVLHRHLPFPGLEVNLIAPEPVAYRPERKFAKWWGYYDKFVAFRPLLKQAAAHADIVHIVDQGNAMMVPWLGRQAHLVTCHDLLAVRAARGEIDGWHVGRTGRMFQKMIWKGLTQAQQIACVSETTRQELVRMWPAAESRSTTILNGPYREATPASADPAQAVADLLAWPSPQPYLLHVGAHVPYKNRPGVLRIFAELANRAAFRRHALVMVGVPFDDEMQAIADRAGIAPRVTVKTGCNDLDLANLYSAADALLFPSFAEGFGLPILEAQSYGCPVFTSDRAPMTEVGGDAVRTFDPTDPVGAANVIESAWDARAEMIARGTENQERFSLEQMIEGYRSLYARLV